jgi:hypothetical protein
MNRNPIYTGLAGAAIALVAMAVTGYVLFWATPGRVSHIAWYPPNTALRVVIQPATIQHYLSGLAPSATRFVRGVPKITSMQPGAFRVDWFHTLPYETALFASMDAPDAISLTLFLNDTPKADDFEGLVNGSSFFRDLDVVSWNPSRVERDAKHVLLAHGSIGASSSVINVQQAPIETSVPDRAPAHLVEIDLNNRSGIGTALLDILTRRYGPLINDYTQNTLGALASKILNVAAFADLIEDDHVRGEFTVLFRPDSPADALRDPLEGLLNEIARALRDEQALFCVFSAAWSDPSTVRATFELRGFERELRHALGNS